MMKPATTLLLVSLLLSPTLGCRSWNIPYRIDVEQGNVVDQEQLDQLRPSMTKRQVAFLLGSPLLEDPFHPNRWDYYHSLATGTGDHWETKLALFFNQAGELERIAGDMRPGTEAPAEALAMEEHKRFTHRLKKEQGPFGAAYDWVVGLFTRGEAGDEAEDETGDKKGHDDEGRGIIDETLRGEQQRALEGIGVEGGAENQGPDGLPTF